MFTDWESFAAKEGKFTTLGPTRDKHPLLTFIARQGAHDSWPICAYSRFIVSTKANLIAFNKFPNANTAATPRTNPTRILTQRGPESQYFIPINVAPTAISKTKKFDGHIIPRTQNQKIFV